MRSLHRAVVGSLVVASLFGARPSPAEPLPDKPVTMDAEQTARLEKAVQPLVDQARKTYPDAKKRFLAGLPRGYRFYVVTRLHDAAKKSEQVFVEVETIKDEVIDGAIASEVGTVSGYRAGDRLRVREDDLVDWVIIDPDGKEEGNLIGNWIDSHPGPY